ncbi:MAG TPA: hypothetical protein VFF81_01780 [Noviherbaspirillum sp.]|nr:hypothetical protein [Noviherbaspirillum sp.]
MHKANVNTESPKNKKDTRVDPQTVGESTPPAPSVPPIPSIPQRQAQHVPFSWLSDKAQANPMAKFVALTMDVCNGVRTCLDIVNSCDLERDAAECGETNDDGSPIVPLLTRADASFLLRLSMASTEMLGELAEKKIGWFESHGIKMNGGQ